MKLLDANIEIRTLLTLTKNPELGSFIMPRVSIDHFKNEATRATFMRIQTLMRQTGKIPHWDTLLADMAIPQDAREYLSETEFEPWQSRKRSKRNIDALEEYRRVRALFDMAKNINNALKADTVDLEKVTRKAADDLSLTRLKSNIEESMIHIDGKTDNTEFLENILRGNSLQLLPTGFKAFDSRNIGIPRGAAWILAATSGGGKSVMALNIAMYQASIGLRTSLTTLEMTREEVIVRGFAKLTKKDMSRFLDFKLLSKSERQEILQTWLDWERKVGRNGGLMTIVAPEEDLTIEDALLTLQPYEYDNNIVDYITLFKGLMGSSDSWAKLGEALRFSKRYASANNNITTILAQLADDGDIRYSKTMREHASNMWTWMYKDDDVRASHIISVKQQKARMQQAFDFTLQENFRHMTISDISDELRQELEQQRLPKKKEFSKGKNGNQGTGKKKRLSEDNESI